MGSIKQLAPGVYSAKHSFELSGVPFVSQMVLLADSPTGSQKSSAETSPIGQSPVDIISPIPINSALAREIAGLGEVRSIIAPNAFHHLYLAQAAHRYEDALVFVAEGVEKKQPELKTNGFLGEINTADLPFLDRLQMIGLAGQPNFNEYVFFHATSKTLIVTDLLFNIDWNYNWLGRVLFTIFGTAGKRPAVSRLFLTMVKNKKAFRESLRTVLDWPFERIVLSHGSVIENNAKDTLVNALAKRGYRLH